MQKKHTALAVVSITESPEHVRAIAAEALGDLGTKAEPAVPALVESLDDESDSV